MQISISEKLVGVEVTGKLLKTRLSVEGEWIDLQELNVDFGEGNFYGGPMPIDLAHTIDQSSPFYELSEKDLEEGLNQKSSEKLQMELIVRLTHEVQKYLSF